MPKLSPFMGPIFTSFVIYISEDWLVSWLSSHCWVYSRYSSQVRLSTLNREFSPLPFSSRVYSRRQKIGPIFCLCTVPAAESYPMKPRYHGFQLSQALASTEFHKVALLCRNCISHLIQEYWTAPFVHICLLNCWMMFTFTILNVGAYAFQILSM